MNDIINGFYIETGYGFSTEKSNVYSIGYVDEYGRLMDMKHAFSGTWDECIKFAFANKNIYEDRRKGE